MTRESNPQPGPSLKQCSRDAWQTLLESPSSFEPLSKTHQKRPWVWLSSAIHRKVQPHVLNTTPFRFCGICHLNVSYRHSFTSSNTLNNSPADVSQSVKPTRSSDGFGDIPAKLAKLQNIPSGQSPGKNDHGKSKPAKHKMNSLTC